MRKKIFSLVALSLIVTLTGCTSGSGEEWGERSARLLIQEPPTLSCFDLKIGEDGTAVRTGEFSFYDDFTALEGWGHSKEMTGCVGISPVEPAKTQEWWRGLDAAIELEETEVNYGAFRADGAFVYISPVGTDTVAFMEDLLLSSIRASGAIGDEIIFSELKSVGKFDSYVKAIRPLEIFYWGEEE